MSRTRKVMISVRLPVGLVSRLDYAVRNTDEGSRSSEIQEAIESWLLIRERQLRELGLDPPK